MAYPRPSTTGSIQGVTRRCVDVIRAWLYAHLARNLAQSVSAQINSAWEASGARLATGSKWTVARAGR